MYIAIIQNFYEEINKIVIDSPKLIACLTFLIGLIVGNWLAIGRDKRKEFNDISLQMFKELNIHIENGGRGKSASTGDCRLIAPYIPIYKRWFFRKAISRYNDAQQDICTYNVATGEGVFNEKKLEHLTSCAKKLLCYLKRI